MMAIGLSDDVFRPRVCSACIRIAKALLFLGVSYFSTLVLLGVIIFLFGQAWFQNSMCIAYGTGCFNNSVVVSVPVCSVLLAGWLFASRWFLAQLKRLKQSHLRDVK